MNAVTLSIASRGAMTERARRAFNGEAMGSFITFPSVDALWNVIRPERWHLLEILTGKEALAVAEVAKLTDRGVDAVRADIEALALAGVVDVGSDGKVVFPFDTIRVDFVLKAA